MTNILTSNGSFQWSDLATLEGGGSGTLPKLGVVYSLIDINQKVTPSSSSSGGGVGTGSATGSSSGTGSGRSDPTISNYVKDSVIWRFGSLAVINCTLGKKDHYVYQNVPTPPRKDGEPTSTRPCIIPPFINRTLGNYEAITDKTVLTAEYYTENLHTFHDVFPEMFDEYEGVATIINVSDSNVLEVSSTPPRGDYAEGLFSGTSFYGSIEDIYLNYPSITMDIPNYTYEKDFKTDENEEYNVDIFGVVIKGTYSGPGYYYEV